MDLTVSSGRKIYVRGSGGYYDATQDAFASQTITLPDDATKEQIAAARLKLQQEMDDAVDLHLFVNGVVTKDAMVKRIQQRKAAYEIIAQLKAQQC